MDELNRSNIKGYELRERIGTGGGGVVYRAYQSTVGREVAIKIILPDQANHPKFIRKFETEAQLVARLEHMHIVPLYDYWRDPEGAYLVMRYLRGGSLRQALQTGPFDLEATAILLDQVSAGLTAAHRANVIHRDIKPDNILLDEDGNAYVVDFGIAKVLEHKDSNLTEEGAIAGSLDYLSPEQARGEDITPRTDIYSLGVVLYEILTQEHPFKDISSIERIFYHINRPLPKIETLDTVDASILENINAVIQKATEKNPALRYDSVSELASAYRQAAGLSISQAGLSIVELLTPREQEVLKHLIKGKSNREIADRLTVELSTVKWYLTQIYRKLNVRSRVQAIVKARELKLISDGFEGKKSSTTSFTGLPEPTNPYKGLNAFTPADASDYFGRDRLIAKLLKKIGEKSDYSRFMAVVGPSGSGKSSLVKAGLIPALWRGEFGGSENWFIAEMTPGSRPLDELEVALTRISADKNLNISEQLGRDVNGLLRLAGMILPNDGSELLLVIDQFEEVFTQLEDDDAREHFLSLLTQAVTDKRSRLRIVVTLRADFYDRPLLYPEFGYLFQNRHEVVLPLGAQELEEAIAKPAERVGVHFEEGLVSSIISDVNYQPGALPLLQYALTELFENREERILTRAAYQEIGGAVGALATRAEEIYHEFNANGQELVRQMFLRLVTMGKGMEDTRRRVERHELLAVSDDVDLMDEIIDSFAAYRLLALDNDPLTHRSTVEVTHEALLQEWERLRGWLVESRSDIQLHRALARAAEDWQASHNDESFLLHGQRLERYATWQTETNLALTAQEQAYLTASIDQQAAEEQAEAERQAYEAALERRSQTTLRWLAVVFLIAAVISGAFAIQANRAEAEAVNQANIASTAAAEAETQRVIAEEKQVESDVQRAIAEEQSTLAISRELSAYALAQISENPELSLLLSIQALETAYTSQAEEVLHSSLQESRLMKRIYKVDGREGEIVGIIYVENESRFLVATNTENLTQYDWLDPVTWEVEALPLAIPFDPDIDIYRGYWSIVDMTGKKITDIYGLRDEKRMIFETWDIQSGVLEETIELPYDGAFWSYPGQSPDKRYLYISNQSSGTTTLWDMQDDLSVEFLTVGGITIPGISPDGKTLVSATPTENIFWDVEESLATGEGVELGRYQHNRNDPALEIEFTPDGQYIAIGFRGTSTEVYALDNLNEPKYSAAIGTQGILRIIFNDDQSLMAIASADGNIAILDFSTGKRLVDLRGNKNYVAPITFIPNTEHLLALNSADSSLQIWDASPYSYGEIPANEETIYSILKVDATPWQINLSQDGKWLSYGSPTTPAGVLNLATGEVEETFAGVDDTGVSRLSFRPGGHQVATVGQDNYIRIWDLASGDLLMEFEGHDNDDSVGATFFGTMDVAYSPNGSQFATAGTDKVAKVWDAESGDLLLTLEGHTAGLTRIIYSPDGKLIATTSDSGDRTARVWDAATGEEIYQLGYPDSERSWGMAFSPDSKLLAIGGSQLGRLKVWEMGTGSEIVSLPISTNSITGVAFTPDGRFLVTGGEAIRVWNTNTWEETSIIATGTISPSIVISNDGKIAYISDSSAARVGAYLLNLDDALVLARSRVTRWFTEEECQLFLQLDTCPPPPDWLE